MMNIRTKLIFLYFIIIPLRGVNFDTEPIKFIFKNTSNMSMGIVFNEKLFQIDPNKEVSLFFLQKKLPITISFVSGTHLNRWSGNLKLLHNPDDKRTERTYELNFVPRIEAKEVVEEMISD